jgi:4-hydroxybenzoate polyprenyltransferase
MRLDKPIGIFLLLYPTLWALLITINTKNFIDYFIFILGVFVTRSAGCVINDICDRDIDKYVARTKLRPLASGIVSLKNAIILFILLNLIAIILALLYFKLLVILLALLAALLYISYPLFKRFFPIPQAYLSICFSFPIFMVFLQIDDKLNYVPIVLFFANASWVVAYDTIYAMVDLTDDRIIGIKTSAITFGKSVGYYILFLYMIFIGLLIILGVFLKYSKFYYFFLIVAALLILKQIIIVFKQIENLYFKMFLSNMWVGFIVTMGFLSRSL